MNAVIEKKPPKPIEALRTELFLPAMQSQLKLALPAHIPPEKFARVAISAVQQNPKLLECDRRSLFAALISCAQIGLVTDAALGEAYLVPYKGRVVLIPGYRGLMALARRSGDIGLIEAECFYANDETVYLLGDHSKLEIKVAWETERGELVGIYALAKDKGGALLARVVLAVEDVEAIRKRSQMPTGPAWADNYEEMAKKTALRRLAKLLPLTPDISRAFRLSELNEELGRPSYIEQGELIEGEATEQSSGEATEPTRRRRTSLDQLAEGSTKKPTPAATPTPAPLPPVKGGNDPQQGDFVGEPKVDPDTGEILR